MARVKDKARDSLLTPNDKAFIAEYMQSGNAIKAIKKITKDKARSDNSLSVQAHRLLNKVKIHKVIEATLDDDFLAKKHAELLNQVRIDYFVFPKRMEDDEIIEHVNSVGIKVITIRESDKGKMAFYSIPDAQAIKGAIEMAYKIKGTFAPEKHVNVNVTVEASERIKLLAKKLNAPK